MAIIELLCYLNQSYNHYLVIRNNLYYNRFCVIYLVNNLSC